MKARGREDQHEVKESDEQAAVKSIDGLLFSWRDEVVGGTRGQEHACILSLV